MKISSKTVAVIAGVALALPMTAVSTSAQAGTAPPPCTKKAIKKAINKAGDGQVSSIDTKKCKDYWAAGAYTVDNMDEASYLLEDNGGKWKVVGNKRRTKLCNPNNDTLPKSIQNRGCVS
jgi:hypothetical protein